MSTIQEKGGNDRLPPPGAANTAAYTSPALGFRGSRSALRKMVVFALGVLLTARFFILRAGTFWSLEADSVADLCPQTAPLVPQKHVALWEELGELLMHTYFKSQAIDWLAGAVRIPTESYDDQGPVGTDPRWDVFGSFHEYLLDSFPFIHSTLQIEKVNTFALLYTWQGFDTSLKPILLTAHQDVVPVDPKTVDEWEHPPYSGFIDGNRIWGRGSSDDKSGLIGLMAAVESLLGRGFQPRRTIVLAFGIDEETSGREGAKYLYKAIESTYGEHSFAMIVDEGGGFGELYGAIFAVPAVAEKGYLDVRVEVSSPGGHSSIPPAHTSIGILSSLLVKYEANPYEAHITRSSPVYETLQCYAAHGPELPSSLRKSIKQSVKSDRALKEVEEELFRNSAFESLVRTTQAIDLIQGGVKTNALPEQAWAVVNHRIATDSSVDAVKKHDTFLLESLASEFKLSYTAFGANVSQVEAPYGTLTLSDAWDSALEPAPITSTSEDAEPYKLLAGTIKATYDAHRSLQNEESIVVSPGVGSGNTDTQYYWNLTKHIFRYNHHNRDDTPGGIHTVNEFIDVDAYLEIIRFFHTLILNADESTLM